MLETTEMKEKEDNAQSRGPNIRPLGTNVHANIFPGIHQVFVGQVFEANWGFYPAWLLITYWRFDSLEILKIAVWQQLSPQPKDLHCMTEGKMCQSFCVADSISCSSHYVAATNALCQNSKSACQLKKVVKHGKLSVLIDNVALLIQITEG